MILCIDRIYSHVCAPPESRKCTWRESLDMHSQDKSFDTFRANAGKGCGVNRVYLLRRLQRILITHKKTKQLDFKGVKLLSRRGIAAGRQASARCANRVPREMTCHILPPSEMDGGQYLAVVTFYGLRREMSISQNGRKEPVRADSFRFRTFRKSIGSVRFGFGSGRFQN